MPIHQRFRGFTLIELLIVIAIIGLTATITIAAVGGARAKARDEKRVTDLKQIQKALELSFEPGSGYPVVASPLTLGAGTTDVLCAKGAVASFAADQGVGNCDLGRVYMGLVPANPTPNGAAYAYRSTNGIISTCTTAPCLGYCVQSSLERGLPQIELAAGAVMVDQSSLRNGTCP
ncbi:MAG: prepilin-type N-terminal cleavage/methylation domain-containing protein [Patescibacteria group bacterium]